MTAQPDGTHLCAACPSAAQRHRCGDHAGQRVAREEEGAAPPPPAAKAPYIKQEEGVAAACVLNEYASASAERMAARLLKRAQEGTGGGDGGDRDRADLVRALESLRASGSAAAAVDVQRALSAFLGSIREVAPRELCVPDVDCSAVPALSQQHASATACASTAAVSGRSRRPPPAAAVGEFDASCIEQYKARLAATPSDGPGPIDVAPNRFVEVAVATRGPLTGQLEARARADNASPLPLSFLLPFVGRLCEEKGRDGFELKVSVVALFGARHP